MMSILKQRSYIMYQWHYHCFALIMLLIVIMQLEWHSYRRTHYANYTNIIHSACFNSLGTWHLLFTSCREITARARSELQFVVSHLALGIETNMIRLLYWVQDLTANLGIGRRRFLVVSFEKMYLQC